MSESHVREDQVRIEYMPLSKLVRAKRNPKEHDLGALGESIARFGYVDPIMVDEASGRIVRGHGRLDGLQAMRARGQEPPERVMEREGDWYVPVVRGVSFESESEAEAYLIADNRITEIGGWDDVELVGVLGDLMAQGEEMLRGVGFDGDDLDEMLRGMKIGGVSEDRDDQEGDKISELEKRAGELVEKYKVEAGGIWRVGGHYIICGDCKDVGVWRVLAKAARIDKINNIMTSPPYAEQRKEQYGGIKEEEYVEWWEGVQANARRYLADNGSFFVNIKAHSRDGERSLYVMDLVMAMVRKWDWRYIDEFCWERISAPGSWPNRFKNGFEPVHHFALDTKIKFRPFNVGGEGGIDVGGSNQSMGNYYNTANKTIEWQAALPSNRLPSSFGNATGTPFPAAYPVGLPEFFVLAFSDKGDAWLDPFLGSGTTIVAAHRQDRIGLGIELLPEFVAISLERLAEETGVEPVRS